MSAPEKTLVAVRLGYAECEKQHWCEMQLSPTTFVNGGGDTAEEAIAKAVEKVRAALTADLAGQPEAETMRQAVEACILANECDNHRADGGTLTGEPVSACRWCRPTAEKHVAAAAPILLAPLAAKVAQLQQELAEAERAMKAVCPDEPEDEGVMFVCLDESGDPAIEAGSLAEAITQLSEWFGDYQKGVEAKRQEVEDTTERQRQTIEAMRKDDIDLTAKLEEAERNEAAMDGYWKNAEAALAAMTEARDTVKGHWDTERALRAAAEAEVATLTGKLAACERRFAGARMTPQPPKDITLAEVAVSLKLSPFEAFQLVTAGKLEGRKQGKQWVVTRASLEAYRRSQAKGA